MEVGNDVVGIVQGAVNARVGKHDTRHAAYGEQEDEAERPLHRHFELDRSAPHGGNPREDLHTGWHGNHHGGEHEVGLRVHADTGSVHVVRPHNEADEADGDHGVGHAEVAEHRLARERRHDLADHAEARQDENVNLRVSKEPEQMLVEERIAATLRREERGAEVAVCQQHRNGACEHRQRQEQQEGGHQNGPNKQRHLVQRHAGCAHVEDGGDEVDGAEDRRGACEMQRKDGEIHGRAGMTRC